MRRNQPLLIASLIASPILSMIPQVLNWDSSSCAYSQEPNERKEDRGGKGRGPWGRGGGGRMMGGLPGIMAMEEVQKEVNLDQSQLEALKKLRDSMAEKMMAGGGFGGPGGPGGPPNPEQMASMRARMQAIRDELEQAISDMLDPMQSERLQGLLIQREGGRALFSKPLARSLELSDEQMKQLADIDAQAGKDQQKMMQEMFAGGNGPGGGWGQMREKMEQFNKEVSEKAIAVLNTDQKSKLESMKGASFEFPQPQWGGPGGPGGRRRGDGGPKGE
jgi:hypothetical protein